MSPTIGRIVHFYSDEADAARPEFRGPYAAIVTGVAPGRVNLVTFGERSMYFHVDVPEGAEETREMHWRWPPRVP